MPPAWNLPQMLEVQRSTAGGVLLKMSRDTGHCTGPQLQMLSCLPYYAFWWPAAKL
jgi:hypothetical protein